MAVPQSPLVGLDKEKKSTDPEKHGDIVVEGSIPTLMKDGIRLHPQPTSDPLDPLNWSRWKKGGILAIVMSLSVQSRFLTDDMGCKS